MTGIGFSKSAIFIILTFGPIAMFAMFITIACLGALLTKPGVDYIKKTFVYVALALGVFLLVALLITIIAESRVNPFVLYFSTIAYSVLLTIAFIRLKNRRRKLVRNI